MKHLNRAGYIATISVMIISVFVVVVIVALSLASFLGRKNISSTEFKERSFALAEACVQHALFKLSRDLTYVGNETVTVDGSDICTVVSITPANPSSTPKLIKAKASFLGATTNLNVTVNTRNLSTVSWEEVGSF